MWTLVKKQQQQQQQNTVLLSGEVCWQEARQLLLGEASESLHMFYSNSKSKYNQTSKKGRSCERGLRQYFIASIEFDLDQLRRNSLR